MMSKWQNQTFNQQTKVPRNFGNLAPHADTPSVRGYVSNFKALLVAKEKIAVFYTSVLSAGRKTTARVDAQITTNSHP